MDKKSKCYLTRVKSHESREEERISKPPQWGESLKDSVLRM